MGQIQISCQRACANYNCFKNLGSLSPPPPPPPRQPHMFGRKAWQLNLRVKWKYSSENLSDAAERKKLISKDEVYYYLKYTYKDFKENCEFKSKATKSQSL